MNSVRTDNIHVLKPQFDLLTCDFRLKASDLELRFCTNETQATREKFVAKLRRLGFDISESEVFPPAPAAIAVLKERGLRPHLLVHDGNASLRTPLRSKHGQGFSSL